MADQETQLHTRFRAIDDGAARQITELLRATAAAAATEKGHLRYDVLAVEGDPTTLYVLETWDSVDDARRHADLVLDDGGLDRVQPLLREQLDTVTLTAITSSTASSTTTGLAA